MRLGLTDEQEESGEGKENNNLGWHCHPSLGGGWVGVIITKLCTRVYVCYVMIFSNFCFCLFKVRRFCEVWKFRFFNLLNWCFSLTTTATAVTR